MERIGFLLMVNVVMNFYVYLELEEFFIGWIVLRCGFKKCFWSVDWDVFLGIGLVVGDGEGGFFFY